MISKRSPYKGLMQIMNRVARTVPIHAYFGINVNFTPFIFKSVLILALNYLLVIAVKDRANVCTVKGKDYPK